MDLAADVQNLPKELYDEIYDLVFTARSTEQVTRIDASYRPPAMLPVSRTTRQKFAASYYRSAKGFELQRMDLLRKWLKNLAVEHKGLIKRIEYSDNLIEKTSKGPFHQSLTVQLVLQEVEMERMSAFLHPPIDDEDDYEDGEGDSDYSDDLREVYRESSGDEDDEMW